MTDEEVLKQSIVDPKVFAILVERYQGAFLRKARAMMRDHGEAEDIVQDAFVQIYLHADSFQPIAGGSFKAWGYKILVNRALTVLKKKKRELAKTASLDPEIMELIADKSGLAEFEQKLDRDYLLSLFSRLPNALARALEWRFIKGRDNKDLAEAEGISEGTAKVRVHRAKQELRNLLKVI